jgi:hypothetical protein
MRPEKTEQIYEEILHCQNLANWQCLSTSLKILSFVI